MTFFVTGASGFLGGRIAQLLASRGDRVRVLVRPGNDLRHLAGFRIEEAVGSLGDPAALRAAVQGCTHIIHCAAASTDWAPWETYAAANATGVRNLLEAARQLPNLERFLHVSTTDVYGYPAVPCQEEAPLVDVGLPYNRTKIRGERAVREAMAGWGMPATIIRPATIYGPRGTAFGRDIAAHLRQGTMAVFDGGRSRGGFCYVDNAADAILTATCDASAWGKVYNLADGTGAVWRDYADRMAAGLGFRRAWINLPSGIALGLARGMEALHSRVPALGRPLLTRHALLLLSVDQEFPADTARRDFGFRPTVSFDEGMERMIASLASEFRK